MQSSSLNQRNYRVVDEHYALIPKADIPRSTFRRIYEHKTTGPSGYLIPVHVDEVLPGDVHTGKMTAFVRLSTLLFPLMDNVCFETQFFFIPARILWVNWKKFMGEQANPGDSISYTIPQVGITGLTTAFSATDLYRMLDDYLGIPVANFAGAPDKNVNALLHRAYNLIYNEWYRDENLQNSVAINTGDGPDAGTDYQLLRRGKWHDYFTGALPSPQKGNPVNLPLSGNAPITGLGFSTTTFTSSGTVTAQETGGPKSYTGFTNVNTPGAAGALLASINTSTGLPQIYADLSQATASTINALRLAVQTQKLLERDARGGTRYTESLQAHWGVHPQDSRLQRPEYIGGGKTDVQTTAIAQTAPTSGTPFGGLSGQAVAAGQHHFTCVGQEHGYILGIASLMTRPTYQEGLHRMFTRLTRYDFPWPEFAALGEQSIRNDEIYTQSTSADPLTFGYQERYAEMRFLNNRVSGLFRTKNVGSISQWHLAQSFSSLPTLGTTFIQETAPFSRVLAAGSAADNMQFLADMLFEIKTTRALPAYGVPGSLLGTF